MYGGKVAELIAAPLLVSAVRGWNEKKKLEFPQSAPQRQQGALNDITRGHKKRGNNNVRCSKDVLKRVLNFL